MPNGNNDVDAATTTAMIMAIMKFGGDDVVGRVTRMFRNCRRKLLQTDNQNLG